MLDNDTNVLLTGVTGLIGGELVRRLVQSGVGRIYCLVRPTAEADASQRLADRLHSNDCLDLLTESRRLRAMAGDVTLPGFGLCDEDAAEVRRSVNMIIHCASQLSFIREASCRETNIEGMRNLIELARSCRQQPLIVHVSTATICGNVSNRCVSESDGDNPNNDHFNEYTRSKAAAELVLKESGLGSLVLRPSIVLSAELPSTDFARAILWFLPLLNEFDAVPIDPQARVDVVPVSFVVDSMVRLLQARKLEHTCYHISGGPAGACSCGYVSLHLDAFYNRSSPLRLIPPGQWTREHHRQYIGTPHQRKVFATLKHYLPFLNMSVVYDNSRLREALGGEPLVIPPMTDYLESLLRLITPRLQVNNALSLDRIPV